MVRKGLIILLLLGSLGSWGQGTKNKSGVKLDFNLDVLSSHLWRGTKNGDSFSLQPTIALNYKKFKVGSWAAFSGNDSYFEIDIFMEYSYRSLSISLYDYFCPPSTQLHNFTDFRTHSTNHTFDFIVRWEPDKIPFRLLASTMIFGDDKDNSTKKQLYSTYIEPSAVWEKSNFSATLFAGFTPFKGYYSDKPSFVDFGVSTTYKFTIRGVVIPITSRVSYNPVLNSTWYMIGVSLSHDI